MLGHAAALGHGLERGIAEALDAQLVAQLPDPDEHLVAREIVEIGEDVPRVEKILGIGKYLDGCLGKSHEVLEAAVRGLVKVLLVEGGLGAQEVFLDAEGRLLGADEGNDKNWVRLAGRL